uniref:Uncharacterized protein n=1 Tax=Parascaris equorum TaxID=6256 RepID=A0A914RN15_PAREQ
MVFITIETKIQEHSSVRFGRPAFEECQLPADPCTTHSMVNTSALSAETAIMQKNLANRKWKIIDTGSIWVLLVVLQLGFD